MTQLSRLFMLMALSLLSVCTVSAQDDEDKIKTLQTEMYKYFSTSEQEKFFEVTEELKAECLKAGNEQLYYKAWGNQAIYNAIHQQRNHAVEMVKEMKEYAKKHDSRFGEYTALHVMAAVNVQMQNFEEAEANFLESIDYLHMFFPGQSAAPAYLELIKVANRRNDEEAGKGYARKVLEEPNLEPQHRIRAISMLCQYAFVDDQRDEFNEWYAKWQEVRKETDGGSLASTLETDYLVINGRYEEALVAAEQLPLNSRAERQADIYHRMGDDVAAYRYLKRFKRVSDSLNRVNQANLLSDYTVQLNSERLENERLALEEQNRSLRISFILTVVGAIIIILTLIIYQRHKTVKHLQQDNAVLDEARNDAEKARSEAEKALDVKREFLNNISHELRTPLNPITGFSDILAASEYELQAEEREVMSKHIKDSSKVLTRLIDNMIELSFYESKSTLPMDDSISPNIICRHMIDSMQPLCKPGVKMEFISTVPNNHKIASNLEGVEKLLKHLLDNAIRFTDQGTITIECGEQGDHFCIAVADTGCGIEPERQDQIFDLFVKTGENVKTTGMGLSICQAILKLLGGRIYLDKAYTNGARFVFELPVASKDDEQVA